MTMALQGVSSARGVERPDDRLRSFRPGARLLPRPNLPIRQTSFVGRSTELSELLQLLAAPDCRLLTIIGPGGVGKTRLALEVADAAREQFADSVAFVPMQTVTAAESIATAFAVAIGCTLTGPGNAREQIARFLRKTQLLLVIDNFEHLIGEAAWIGELLAVAPDLRMLVTSREVLNLREEWRYPLAGLSVPAEDRDDVAQSEAVRLFVERARQVRPDFSLANEQPEVVRLCRMTEGHPLAIELAAAWTPTLSCKAIAGEIERNIAFLSTGLRNVPERHRSIQATFDYSWVLLSEDERRIFQRLAVFRGGFSREAAEQIAGATLPLLSSLVDKSLVRVDADGRFYLHELLRQYADDRLRADPDDAARTIAAHQDYYITLVADRFGPLTGGGQVQALTEIGAATGNIRAAWRGAVAAGDVTALERTFHTLSLFFDFRARYREGMELLDEGIRALRQAEPSPQVDRVLAAMLVDATRLNHKLGQLAAMRETLEEAEARYAQIPGPPSPGLATDPQLWRALIELVDGRYAEAAQHAEAVIERNEANGRPGNLPLAWWARTAAALWQEDPSASDFAPRSTEAALAIGDLWMLAYSYNLQGHVAIANGAYSDARQHYEASYALRETFNDPEGMGTSLVHMARVATLQGEWDEAEQLYRRSLAMAREIGDLVTMALALNGLGLKACSTDDYAAAGEYFAEGLRLTGESGFVRLLLTFLTSTGDWLIQTGQPAAAAGPLALAQTHPGSDHETRIRAGKLLATVEATLPAAEYASAIENSQGADPTELATTLIPLLTAPVTAPDDQQEPDAASSALIEPLTTRELDVLRLIAAGHSNREIAEELYLAVNTIRSYSQQLYGKLGVNSRTQAIARARELGLIS